MVLHVAVPDHVPGWVGTSEVPATPHAGLHSEKGALRGEHLGRARQPVVKVVDLAWLELEKPDLARAEAFAHDFGFATAARTPDSVHLRGTHAGTACMVLRHGPRSRFVGPAFQAASRTDLDRLAAATGTDVERLEQPGGGWSVLLHDPSGLPVRVVHGCAELPALPPQRLQHYNTGGGRSRVNTTQRPPTEPARVQRLGHVVLETTTFSRTLEWYLQTLGMIVSDFLFLDEQRGRGPTMAFIRCDRGSVPADHHTLALHLGPGGGTNGGYVHSAYEVADLDAVAAGGQHLLDRGHHRVWGIGRHVQGSQLFDYWRDPDDLMVEHFADGDVFDCAMEPGWAPMSASGLSQWGPPVTRDFLGTTPSPELARSALRALAGDNELTTTLLLALAKAMTPR